MKATGIVRQLDDLGRIVIPKEIRTTLRLKPNAKMELYLNSERGIVLQPYEPEGPSKSEQAKQWLKETIKSSHCARFSIEGGTISCEIVRTSGRYASRYTGEAKCDPKDVFDPSIGMVISFCRAQGWELPDFLKN